MNEQIYQIKEWIKKNNIFLKVFSVTVVSILLVSIFITLSTIRVSTNLFMDTFSITNSKIISQIRSRFDVYSSAVATTINQVESSGTVKRVLSEEEVNSLHLARSYYDIVNEIDRIYTNLQPLGANLIVSGMGQKLYNMNYSKWPVSQKRLQTLAITEETIAIPNQINYHIIESNELNGEGLIVSTKALTERMSDHIYGLVYVSIRESQLRDFYQEYTSEENMVLLINQTGQIVSSNDVDMIGLEERELLALAQSTDIPEVDQLDVELWNREYILLSEYLPGFDMYLVNLIDKQLIIRSLINTREIVLISMMIVLFALVMVLIVTRRITKSLTYLVKQITKLTRHNFSERIAETGGYESRQIAKAYNYTLDELEAYVKIVVESQKNQRDAELRALQHQINPHFLYNTLTTVKFMVMQGDAEKAMGTIHALISLLQSALGEVNETVTVEQELGNMKHYVAINQARYGDQINVNYFVAPDVLKFRIPKLVLQPFIENAFFHGFNEKKTGFIQILIRQYEDMLICEVVDDGDGMKMSKGQFPYIYKEKRQMFSGIGMRNVHERILLLYGDEYGVQVTSEMGEGTKVTVRLPIIENEASAELH